MEISKKKKKKEEREIGKHMREGKLRAFSVGRKRKLNAAFLCCPTGISRLHQGPPCARARPRKYASVQRGLGGHRGWERRPSPIQTEEP